MREQLETVEIVENRSTQMMVERLTWLRDPAVWITLITCLWIVGCSWAQIGQQMDLDEGVFLTIGQGILHGKVPYLDIFDQKGPGVYYVIAAVLLVMQHATVVQQFLVLRVIVILVNGSTAVGMLALGRRWWSPGVGALAALLWLFAAPLYEGYQVLTEPFSIALMVWALVVVGRWPGIRGAFLGGELVALSALFQQTAGVALVGTVLIALAFTPRESPPSDRARFAAAVSAAGLVGFALPWIVVVGAFANVGALGSFFDQVLMANVRYPAKPLAYLEATVKAQALELPILWFAPLVVIGVSCVRWGMSRRGERMPNAGMLATVVVGLLCMIPFARHAYPHYWIAVAPWAALVTASGVFALMKRLVVTAPDDRLVRSDWRRAVALPSLMMLLVAGSAGRTVLPTQFISLSPELKSEIATGQWIEEKTPPHARLLIGPADAELYYLSHRFPATTFVYLLPVNSTPALLNEVTAAVEEGQFDVIFWNVWYNPQNYEPIAHALTIRYHPTGEHRSGVYLYTLKR